jgi:chromate transporter
LSAADPPPARGGPSALREVAGLFLRLGATAFGGPAAHVALMEDEVVVRRRWLPREQFLDLVGATNLIPGPNSTELAIHLGWRRAGAAGLVAAGACFILPAALITALFAWVYVRCGTLPAVAGAMAGIRPVVLAIVLQAIVRLARPALRGPLLAAVGIASAAAALAGIHELLILALAGAFTAALALGRAGGRGAAGALLLGVDPLALFVVFAKIGSVLFGSGYVLVAFLRSELVGRLGWLTEGQLLDAVAAGQVTPGPVFSTATFVGYLLAGPAGAIAATAGIFLPAFVFVALSGPLLPRLRRSRLAGALLDGVNAGSLGLMAAVTLALAPGALQSPATIALGAAALALLLATRVNPGWLVLGGGLAGWLLWS